jgi:hypothetical protein
MKSAAELSKERRELLKKQNLCINCGKCPPHINRVKCFVCLEAARISCRKYLKENPNAKEVRSRWKTNPQSRIKHRESRKRWRLKLKYKVIVSLGGKCECCQDKTFPFLQIDHVNKDGKKHRSEIGRSVKMFKDMLKFPNKYKLRVLCANCHFAITNLGTCPHKDNNYEFSEVQPNNAPAMEQRCYQR